MSAWQPEPQVIISLGDLPVRLPDMDAIIELINEGHYDDHLEDLLAAAHGRKRERRGSRVPYGVRVPRSG